jgi:AcrR family transcriptional regulator
MPGKRPKKTNRRKREYHHGDLPAALLKAAKSLVAERGVEGFTLREVARRLGVSHVAAYRHYADRRALLAAVAEHGFGRLGARLEAARSGKPESLEPRLRAVLTAYLRFCWEEPALAAVMFGPRLSRGGEFPRLEAAVMASLGVIEETITTLSRARERRRTPRDAALALWTFVHGFSILAHDKAAYPTASEAALAFDGMLTPMLTGLFPRSGARREPAAKRTVVRRGR